MTASKIPSLFFFLLIILAVIYYGLGAAATASVDLTWSHADKHGADIASTIRDACNNGGALRTFQQSKFRFIQICKLDADRYGCRILDLVDERQMTFEEVTAFVKDCFTGKPLKAVDDYAQKNFWTRTNIRIK